MVARKKPIWIRLNSDKVLGEQYSLLVNSKTYLLISAAERSRDNISGLSKSTEKRGNGAKRQSQRIDGLQLRIGGYRKRGR